MTLASQQRSIFEETIDEAHLSPFRCPDVRSLFIPSGLAAQQEQSPELQSVPDTAKSIGVGEDDPNPAAGNGRVIATIRGDNGAYVEWIEAPAAEGAERIAIGVMATYPAVPMLADEFIEEHTPLEIYMALSDADGSPPEELIRQAVALGRVPDMSASGRAKLRKTNTRMLEHFRVEGSTEKQSCSPAFRNWVGQVFGDEACGGQTIGEHRTLKETYCTQGCDHPLGSVDRSACIPSLKSCNIVEGRTRYYAGRVTNYHGDGYIGWYGRWQHLLAANCQGNGPLIFKRTRGNTQIYMSVPVGTAYHYYWGHWPIATAETNVTYGSWQNGIANSGSGHVLNRVDILNNRGAEDLAIFCADIRYRRDMSDASAGSCQGSGVHLCTGGNCDSACFNCVGGTCN